MSSDASSITELHEERSWLRVARAVDTLTNITHDRMMPKHPQRAAGTVDADGVRIMPTFYEELFLVTLPQVLGLCGDITREVRAEVGRVCCVSRESLEDMDISDLTLVLEQRSDWSVLSSIDDAPAAHGRHASPCPDDKRELMRSIRLKSDRLEECLRKQDINGARSAHATLDKDLKMLHIEGTERQDMWPSDKVDNAAGRRSVARSAELELERAQLTRFMTSAVHTLRVLVSDMDRYADGNVYKANAQSPSPPPVGRQALSPLRQRRHAAAFVPEQPRRDVHVICSPTRSASPLFPMFIPSDSFDSPEAPYLNDS